MSEHKPRNLKKNRGDELENDAVINERSDVVIISTSKARGIMAPLQWDI